MVLQTILFKVIKLINPCFVGKTLDPSETTKQKFTSLWLKNVTKDLMNINIQSITVNKFSKSPMECGEAPPQPTTPQPGTTATSAVIFFLLFWQSWIFKSQKWWCLLWAYFESESSNCNQNGSGKPCVFSKGISAHHCHFDFKDPCFISITGSGGVISSGNSSGSDSMN